MIEFFFLSLIIFFPVEVQLVMLLFYLMLMILNLFSLSHFSEISFFISNNDFLSISLIILSTLTWILMIFAWGKKSFLYLENKMLFLFWSLSMILFSVFLTNNFLSFYILFEVSLIPISMMILGWGGQPERKKASIFLMFYTIISSLPLLVFIMNFSKESYYFKEMMIFNSSIFGFYGMEFFIMLGFLIKFPMFIFHLWLPKAHVEAPVSGSMILASVLLKLGGYGMLRMIFFVQKSEILLFISYFSVWGGVMASFLCLRQKDIKVLIAYSSVCHMSMVISCSLTQNHLGVLGAIFMMLAHGMASSGLFCIANLPYERNNSRSFLISKNFLNVIPLISLFWFILSAANMAAPPSINLISEIIMIIFILNKEFSLVFPVFLLTFLAVAYSLFMYTSPNHPRMNTYSGMLFPLNFREIETLFIHSGLVIMMIFLFLVI